MVKGNEHEKPNKGDAALKILTEHIAQQLKEREFCVVFEHDLERMTRTHGRPNNSPKSCNSQRPRWLPATRNSVGRLCQTSMCTRRRFHRNAPTMVRRAVRMHSVAIDDEHSRTFEFPCAKLVQRSVSFLQCECFRVRSNGNARRNFEKLVAIASGQVCH